MGNFSLFNAETSRTLPTTTKAAAPLYKVKNLAIRSPIIALLLQL